MNFERTIQPVTTTLRPTLVVLGLEPRLPSSLPPGFTYLASRAGGLNLGHTAESLGEFKKE